MERQKEESNSIKMREKKAYFFSFSFCDLGFDLKKGIRKLRNGFCFVLIFEIEMKNGVFIE